LGEQKAQLFAAEGLDIVIIRPGWVYGPGDRRTLKLSRAVAEKKFVMVTKGKTCQTPVYIDDLISGVLLCAEKAEAGELFHLAGREALTVKEIVKLIAGATGVAMPPFSLPLFPVFITAWTMEKVFSLFRKDAPLTTGKLSFFIHPKPLSIQKATKELGYSPETNFETGVRATVSWYREHGWLR
jgi:dihydroflavonol-4-reductase